MAGFNQDNSLDNPNMMTLNQSVIAKDENSLMGSGIENGEDYQEMFEVLD